MLLRDDYGWVLKQRDRQKMKNLIKECLEFLKFAELIQNLDDKKERDLEEIEIIIKCDYEPYGFIYHPWITSFKIGKHETIFKLLDIINGIENNDEIKHRFLKDLLLNNYDLIDGNNILMVSYKNNDYKLIVDVLNFLKSNGYLNELKLLLKMGNKISGMTLMDHILSEIQENDVESNENLKIIKRYWMENK